MSARWLLGSLALRARQESVMRSHEVIMYSM